MSSNESQSSLATNSSIYNEKSTFLDRSKTNVQLDINNNNNNNNNNDGSDRLDSKYFVNTSESLDIDTMDKSYDEIIRNQVNEIENNYKNLVNMLASNNRENLDSISNLKWQLMNKDLKIKSLQEENEMLIHNYASLSQSLANNELKVENLEMQVNMYKSFLTSMTSNNSNTKYKKKSSSQTLHHQPSFIMAKNLYDHKQTLMTNHTASIYGTCRGLPVANKLAASIPSMNVMTNRENQFIMNESNYSSQFPQNMADIFTNDYSQTSECAKATQYNALNDKCKSSIDKKRKKNFWFRLRRSFLRK